MSSGEARHRQLDLSDTRPGRACKCAPEIHAGLVQFKPMVGRLVIVGFCFWLEVSHAYDRIWVPANINGKPVRLVFDTGATDLVLWRAAAQRLGLKFTAPQTNASVAPGEVLLGFTEECTLKLMRTRVRGQLAVADLPDYFLSLDAGGFIVLGAPVLPIIFWRSFIIS